MPAPTARREATTLRGSSTRRSLAGWMRGWGEDGAGLEHRLRDAQALRRAHSRRWVLTAGVFVLGILGWLGGAVRTVPRTMFVVVLGAAIVNALAGSDLGLR
jgi:hypothetical protein